MKCVSRWALLVLVGLGCSLPAHAQLVPGLVAYDEGLVGVRFRAFGTSGAGEIYLGIPDLGVGANRSEGNLVWADQDYPFTFNVDRVNDELVATIGGQTVVFPDLEAEVAARTSRTYTLDDLNVVQIDVGQRDAGSTVQVLGLTANGEALGDLVPSNNSAIFTWTLNECVATPDLSSFTGTLSLAGPFGNSQDLSRVQIALGVREEDGLGCGLESGESSEEAGGVARPIPVMDTRLLGAMILILCVLGLAGIRRL